MNNEENKFLIDAFEKYSDLILRDNLFGASLKMVFRAGRLYVTITDDDGYYFGTEVSHREVLNANHCIFNEIAYRASEYKTDIKKTQKEAQK